LYGTFRYDSVILECVEVIHDTSLWVSSRSTDDQQDDRGEDARHG